MTQEEFENRARLVHGDKYDYTKVEYKNSSTKVCIVCPKHGDFMQYPQDHFRGHGCSRCGAMVTHQKRGMRTTERFIEESKAIWGDKYTYEKTLYEASGKDLVVTCPIHGDFITRPNRFLRGVGCAKCANKRLGENRRTSCEEFIEKATNVHKNRYDYSLVEYKTCRQKVKIICPKHGVFEQNPQAHLKGVGCPHCKQTHGEEAIFNFLSARKIDFLYEYIIKVSVPGTNQKFLKIDFYVPSLNLFIEYNGEQHYSPLEYFGGEERFKEQKRRDEFLQNYCNRKGYKLIIIPYYERKNIDSILNNVL